MSQSASELDQLWKNVLKAVKDEVPRSSYQAWIKPIHPLKYEGKKITLEVKNEFNRNLLLQTYYQSLSKALKSQLGSEPEIFIEVNSDLPTENYVPALSTLIEDRPKFNQGENPTPLTLSQLPSNKLNPRFQFASFIVGQHNQFCHAVAINVAERLSEAAYNPFFIYGGVGLGKTHIMQAIAQYALERNNRLRVLYQTAENFLNEMIDSLRKSKMNEFRQRYRQVDLLLVDDVQFIEGKESTQEEFFHTFNSIKESGGQIVLTSDRPPKSLAKLEARLVSRFEGGLIADIQVPSYETRLAILQRRTSEMKFRLKPEILDLLALAFPQNIRQLDGALVKLQAYAQFTGKPITAELVSQILHLEIERLKEEEYNKLPKPKPETSLVLDEVGKVYAIDSAKITGRESSPNLRQARQLAMYLLRELGLTLNEIGQIFNGRGNSSILNACRQASERLTKDPGLLAKVSALRKKLN
ncbi:MAG: chromosomal replication initiator protein DnaA [Candidatus Caenarcaniphilales bacterium]|nr:chromosomal replication initiator protein DnaA [Candidatus Caenarcaniphilales bacterium]